MTKDDTTQTPPAGTLNDSAGDGDAPAPVPVPLRVVELGDRTFHLVGTAHVSPKSVEDVRETIAEVGPDTVAVELCQGRYTNLMDREAWRQLDIFQVLRQGRAPLLLSSLLMSSFQRRIAEKFGVEPGAEMAQAVRSAEEIEADVALIDRDVQITLRRTWARVGFWQRFKVMFQLAGGLLLGEDVDEEEIEQLKNEGQLEDLMQTMAKALPEVKETLIDERDVYMAEKLRQTTGDKVVAVVGAGHLPGLTKALERSHDLAPLEEIPKPSLLPKLLKWGIPLAIVALLVLGFFRGGAEASLESIYVWIGVNGVLAAIGAAIALGHPLTIISAFLAAPLTSLNPMIAAGWVAGLVQAWAKRPKVVDLERLSQDITTVKGFWSNAVCRVLLVVVLCNLGSVAGTALAGSWIAARLF